MGFIDYHQGCPPPGKNAGCFGPVGRYYTIFDSELRVLKLHIFVSIFIGMGLFFLLFYLDKKEKIRLNVYLSIIISLVSAVCIFFILAYLFPIRVVY